MNVKKSRGVLIAGNWKMNHGLQETRSFFADLSDANLSKLASTRLQAALFPPMLSLESARRLAGTLPFPIAIGAQNAHWEKKGAFTGEVSGPMLREQGIETVLIGHSERRQYFGETDETACKRARSLIEQGFRVIFCIGETRGEREQGKTEQILARQLGAGLPSLSEKFVIAYEPVWAIGTGLTATPQQAEEAHLMIRRWLATNVDQNQSEKTLILYGGSVTPENIHDLLAGPNVDGALVGGASLKAESFLALLEAGAGRV